MRRYDLRCSICGTWNCGLDLEETNGHFECEKCGTVSDLSFLIKLESQYLDHMSPHENQDINVA